MEIREAEVVTSPGVEVVTSPGVEVVQSVEVEVLEMDMIVAEGDQIEKRGTGLEGSPGVMKIFHVS